VDNGRRPTCGMSVGLVGCYRFISLPSTPPREISVGRVRPPTDNFRPACLASYVTGHHAVGKVCRTDTTRPCVCDMSRDGSRLVLSVWIRTRRRHSNGNSYSKRVNRERTTRGPTEALERWTPAMLLLYAKRGFALQTRTRGGHKREIPYERSEITNGVDKVCKHVWTVQTSS